MKALFTLPLPHLEITPSITKEGSGLQNFIPLMMALFRKDGNVFLLSSHSSENSIYKLQISFLHLPSPSYFWSRHSLFVCIECEQSTFSCEPAPNPYRARILGSQWDYHCLCFHYPLLDLNHPKTFLFSTFAREKQKWGNTLLMKTPQKSEFTAVAFYCSPGLILQGPLQNCSLGCTQWVQPSFKCLQRWGFPWIHKCQMELSDLCVICKELGMIRK